MKKYDIGMGHLGNGLTVWNRAEEEHGDYKKVAHINHDRTVKFYEELPQDIKQMIFDVAKNSNMTISATQSQKVFY